MLMNNRFVVPGVVDNASTFSSLHTALTTPGLNAGDVIQIEPNSSPGLLVNADVPGIKNLTIQGDAAFDVHSIPFFHIGDNVTIQPNAQGFTLKNVEVDIQNGDLAFQADCTITRSVIQNNFDGGEAISLAGTSAAVISNCYIENSNPLVQFDDLLYVTPASGSHNLITDNQFVALSGSQIDLLRYSGGTGGADVVAHNTFTGNTGQTTLLEIQNGNEGLTVQGNAFTNDDPMGTAIVVYSAQNFRILDNVISLPNGGEGIYLSPGFQSVTTSVVIAHNHINTGGQGNGIDFSAGISGSSLVAKVEDNDLHGNSTGVVIGNGLGGTVSGIDLGLGAQGSLGCNNFRGDTTAIDVSVQNPAVSIGGQQNIFGVPNPMTVIHDQNTDPTLAAVVSTHPLTGNAAYVETLYLDYLQRTGDVNNPNDAGHWVTLLGQGTPAATVANAIVRSPEGLGVSVDGLYHRFLGRDADPAGRAYFVNYLETGGTLEGVSWLMLGSPEYRSHFPSDASFVQSLYQNLLQRTGSLAEVNGWVAQLPQLGRAGVAQGFLLSHEYRAAEVANDYLQLLHRPPSTPELNNWTGSSYDVLTIDFLFAASPEFQMNG
jgi:hypothetical protein